MKTLRTLLLALALPAVAALFGCGGSSADNLFVGTWFAPDGRSLTFSDSTWYDSDGDAGDYELTGEYPIFTVTFILPDRTYSRHAEFIDHYTMDLCLAFASGTVFDCVRLIKDRPIQVN